MTNSKERINEIIQIFKKLKDLNLGIDTFEEFDEFRNICNQFIKDGKYVEGEIKVLGTKRIICYSFKESIDCMLKYDNTV
jgi:hypothetical protein